MGGVSLHTMSSVREATMRSFCHSGFRVSRDTAPRRALVTSPLRIMCTVTAPAGHKPCVSSVVTPIQTSSKTHRIISSRLQDLTRQFTTSAISNKETSREYDMSSDDSRAHNNQDFQLSELFNVKDKVALITGNLTISEKWRWHNNFSQVEDQVSA